MTILDSILGTRTIDARAAWVGGAYSTWDLREVFSRRYDDSSVFALRLDGRWFLWQEDLNDDYRSSCKEPLEVSAAAIPPDGCIVFPPRVVVVSHVPDNGRDVIIGTDQATDRVLFTVGTDHTNDYYPNYTAEFVPPGTV